jgi:hypothetical protein
MEAGLIPHVRARMARLVSLSLFHELLEQSVLASGNPNVQICFARTR